MMQDGLGHRGGFVPEDSGEGLGTIEVRGGREGQGYEWLFMFEKYL